MSELQAKMAEGEKDNAKLYIKGEVIRMYQEMKLAQKLVLISSKGESWSRTVTVKAVSVPVF